MHTVESAFAGDYVPNLTKAKNAQPKNGELGRARFLSSGYHTRKRVGQRIGWNLELPHGTDWHVRRIV